MLSKKPRHPDLKNATLDLDAHTFHDTDPVPKYALPQTSMSAEMAYDIVNQEMNLDGNPVLNLASFVTTRMPEKARQLMLENINKNYVDIEEYPQTAEIQNRCVHMLADLFHAPEDATATGTATVGSSEAIHLAGLALKWNWRKRREAAGLPTNKPNIVMGGNVQVCWEKFARYFDVEPRYVTLTESRFIIGVEEAMALVDENTIAVVGILGSTLTGEFEPIAELDAALDKLNATTGWEVPLHVDAASGGFVAPFAYPDLAWDFRLKWVRSINVSGHKYGLVYPGVGWVIWRSPEDLPEELIFHVNYLGNDEPTFNLNFSKNANNIIAQYFNFLHLGRAGYTRIMQKLLALSHTLADGLTEMGHFEIISQRNALPVVCVKLKPHLDNRYSVFELSEKLRERGWIVPAYTLAPNAESLAVLRIVIREGFNRDMVDLLLEDIERAVEKLQTADLKSIRQSPAKKSYRRVC